MTSTPKARTCFFVKDTALEMATVHTSLIPDSVIIESHRIGTEDPFLVEFTIAGTPFMAMNGNEQFEARPDHAISIMTKDQAETDRLWAALVEGG